jgi:hypothetical protein
MSAVISLFRTKTWFPIVLEEQKKWFGEKQRSSGMSSHYNRNESAVHLVDGIPVCGAEALNSLFRKNLLSRKNSDVIFIK